MVALTELAEQINGIIQAHMGGEANQIRTAAERIVKMLIAAGLAFVNKCQCDNVGTHMHNRDGTGLDVEKVHTLAQRICNQGWVWEEVRNAWAFEMPPGDQRQAQFQFNVQLVNSAEGYLAPWEDINALRYLSVTSSHTVAGLRCVKFGARSDQAGISTGGKTSRDVVSEIAPSYLEAVDNGMDWAIIRHEVEAACPMLPHFLQESGNAGHGTEQVTTAVEKTPPHLSGHVRDMCDFVEQYSGGSDTPHCLTDLETWAKTRKVSKDVEGRSFKMLAKILFKQGPEHVVGMLKAMVASPGAFVRDGVSRPLTSSDCDAVTTTKKAHCLRAASYTKSGKAWLEYSVPELGNHQVAMLIGDFQIRLVMHVHGKKAKGWTIYKSVDEVASAMLDDWAHLPWTFIPKSPKADEKKGTIVQFGSSGGIDEAVLARMDFQKGKQVVSNKDSSKIYTIASIGKGIATFKVEERQATKLPNTLDAAKLADEFKA
ncbi:unnamed protein product [Prorocentrum cordatum]|uniref:Uncharacterized protein n=1 Tax=Prorocentrum cordatum TaxID=2364126 RepID=A0ABN9TFE0_9DINO|nr:unnamed protein product [Polarella glacialis]